MLIATTKIIAFQAMINHGLWIFQIARKDCGLYNKQKNTWEFGNTRFISRVDHHIPHSFAVLTREISCSTLEINLLFSRTHALFSIYLEMCRIGELLNILCALLYVLFNTREGVFYHI